MRAAIVGSGPNGLAAAIELARAGVEPTVFEAHARPGGALRSAEPFGAGHVVDLGATSMPFAAISPVLSRLPLAEHGLRWSHAPVPLAHPLDDGPVALLHYDIERTAEGLGRDGRAWRALHEPIADRLRELAETVLAPMLPPRGDPLLLARFGARAALPAAALARLAFREPATRALFAGSAAHAWQPLSAPLTSSFGVLLGAAAHAAGWPVVEGGSERLAEALVRLLRSLGGTVVTEAPIDRIGALDSFDMVLLDVAPRAAARILDDRVPAGFRAALRRYRHAPAAAKVDLLLDGEVPWRDPAVADAGVVHLGGGLEEIAAAERAIARGSLPERPFTLLAQQAAHDPTRRADDGRRAVWAYAHVPHGAEVPALELVSAQIERFAPGFRDRIVAAVETGPAQLERENPNLVGGDIVGGSTAGTQLLLRPTRSLIPYRTPDPGVWLCSASTPPGAGVHGMAGHHAARAALRAHGIEPAPLPAPAPSTVT
ncbi:phytoene desaturase family protein [Agrococcus baldri]|uniref:P49 secreted protein n=1 Tax=Agrococcus baldri TaxID=153730 RepID=A0AA87RGE9_9MICO|nr:NAD(P)/FAD-dependent oxidoreductase [Agrococcus baldri]GEK79991.1 P49 secreted protein [Agrococcus baldri]